MDSKVDIDALVCKLSKIDISKKKNFGQYYTTNYSYILQNMDIPDGITLYIEPFAGNGDLVKYIEEKNGSSSYSVELYDIDPKYAEVVKRDTIAQPPDYSNKYVITNPPYLARNKSNDKALYDQYGCNDLYKCFIKTLLSSGKALGGIIIVPLNFLSSVRKMDIELRKSFLAAYDLLQVNIFEERVFDDTAYSVCSIQFARKSEKASLTRFHIFPSNETMELCLTSANNYSIGGELYGLPQDPRYTIERATRKTNYKSKYMSNIVLKCIDDSKSSTLGFYIEEGSAYIDNTEKLSARSYATLVFNIHLTDEQQKELANKANQFININRTKYNSLFLTNYRESNTIARKRITFELAFNICNYIMSDMLD